jgi:hypothetical protein
VGTMGPSSSSSKPMRSLNPSNITRGRASLQGTMEMSLMRVVSVYVNLGVESKNTETEMRVGTVTRRGGNRPQY